MNSRDAVICQEYDTTVSGTRGRREERKAEEVQRIRVPGPKGPRTQIQKYY